MSEQRPTYGPTPTWLTHATYQVVIRDQSESCECKFSVQARDALSAAAESLAMIQAATGQHQVVNLQLMVSLDL